MVVATSGDTGGAAVEAFRGRAQVDLVVLFPNGRISDVQRRMITTAPDDNVHALAIDGTFDDCQAIVKGLFNHHAFRDRVRLSGVNSINFARIVAQVVYYFTAAVALGAPDAQNRVYGADRKLRRYLCRLCRRPHGPAGRSPGDRHQRQRHSGACAQERRLRDCTRSPPPPRPPWISRSPRISSARCSKPRVAMPRAVRTMMGALVQSRRFVIPARALADLRASFSADCADEQETAATIRTVRARGRLPRRPAYRGRDRGCREGTTATGRRRWSCCRPRTRPSFRPRSKPPAGCAPRCPTGSPICRASPNVKPSCAADQTAVEHFISSVSRVAREGAAA